MPQRREDTKKKDKISRKDAKKIMNIEYPMFNLQFLNFEF